VISTKTASKRNAVVLGAALISVSDVEAGAFLNFAVAPGYYQTGLSSASCVAVFVALLVASYQLRLRRVARQFNIRLEERIRERTRVARSA